jgi:hypothetical protein
MTSLADKVGMLPSGSEQPNRQGNIPKVEISEEELPPPTSPRIGIPILTKPSGNVHGPVVGILPK